MMKMATVAHRNSDATGSIFNVIATAAQSPQPLAVHIEKMTLSALIASFIQAADDTSKPLS